MQGLKESALTILSAYANKGNRELYWNYLAHKQGNDGYGLLALGVVRNDNAPGATANAFANNQARSDGIDMTEREWNTFGVELMKFDLEHRQKQLERGRPDLALNLPVREIEAVHDRTFKDYHINPNAWTPRELLDAARRHGGDAEAEKVWTMMLDNTALGLGRMSSTSADIVHRYNDGQLDATSYMTRMGVARTEATQALRNGDPNRIGSEGFYALYDTRSGQWTQVTSMGGQVTMRPVHDADEIQRLDDTRQLRLQRQELRGQFHPDDPYRDQPIVRSPYLLSDGTPAHPQDAPARSGAAGPVAGSAPDAHPHQALRQQCSAGVDALDRQLGRSPDQNSACMTASLTTLAAANGFERVDHVLLSERSGQVQAGQNVIIVQGARDDPAHLRAHMPTDQAIGTPVETSQRDLAQIAQRQAQALDAPTQSLQQAEHSHGARTLGA